VWEHFKDKTSLKGYGYFFWKPQIVLQTLEKMQDGDTLHYMDSGCHLNLNGKKRLLEYFKLTENSNGGILGFQAAVSQADKNIPSYDWLERQYTKGDLLDYFSVREKQVITETGQIVGTTFFVRRNSETINFFKNYLKVFYDDFSLVTDEKSKSPNLDGYIVHRHDQSIFSLLSKIYAADTIPNAEIEAKTFDNKRIHGNATAMFKDYPIWALRDTDVDLIWPFSKLPFYRKELIRRWMNCKADASLWEKARCRIMLILQKKRKLL
jgi:hypothetical protein